MTPLATFLSIAVIHALGVMSPGPDFAVIMRQSLRYGWRIALLTAAGIGSGILLHVALTMFGITALMQVAPWSLTVLQLFGAAFLAWIGWQGLTAKPSVMSEDSNLPSRKQAFLIGLATNALNVKALLFFAALFSSLLATEQTPVALQVALLVYLPVATACLFSLIALLIGNVWVRQRLQQHGYWLDRIMGAVLLLLSIYVVSAVF
ncbi:LysE family translocator [Salinibius halmophilus]|uniref:LysE family translocator n=1 Tax=Salinibius halmophilus TaxID=1853216 RepID=UPI000E665D42|nr:LysE family translocator [Salinibius halmophilus]